MDAILYTSESGFTARYAELLGQATGLPVHSLAEAPGRLPRASRVVYLGWLMAGGIKGCKKALAGYQVQAVCAVGMGAPGGQTPQALAKQNHLPATLPVFYLQGGFDRTKLHGLYRFMMDCMAKGVGKKLAEKPDRTPEEEDMLGVMLHGGSHVSPENLAPILAWLREREGAC